MLRASIAPFPTPSAKLRTLIIHLRALEPLLGVMLKGAERGGTGHNRQEELQYQAATTVCVLAGYVFPYHVGPPVSKNEALSPRMKSSCWLGVGS